MWRPLALIRPLFIGLLLSCSILLASPAARACKFSCYTGSTDEEWVGRADDWTGSLPPLDAEGPFLLILPAEHGPLELRVNGESRDFDEQSISGDDDCDQQLVSISPAKSWKVGDSVEVATPSGMASLDDPNASEQGAWTISKEVGEARERAVVSLRIEVKWVPQWELPFADALCPPTRLAPFTSYGYATVFVDSDSGDFDFSAQATMMLPDETEYRSITYNRYQLYYFDDRLQGTPESGLTLQLPLTRSDSAPECFHLTLFDDRLVHFYDEEVCPPSDLSSPYREEARAILRRLPPPPSLAETEAGGCSWVGQSRSIGVWRYWLPFGIVYLLQLKRRRRLG
jgi:hypothetical protein